MSRRYERVKAIGYALIGITFLASAIIGLYLGLSGDSVVARSGDDAGGSFVATASFLGLISLLVLVVGALHLLRQRRRK